MIAAAFGAFVCSVGLVFAPSGADPPDRLVGGRFVGKAYLIFTHFTVPGACRE